MFHSHQGLADSHLDENTFSETFNKLVPDLWNCIKDKAVQKALALSFTRPPVPPSVSEREIERVKAVFPPCRRHFCLFVCFPEFFQFGLSNFQFYASMLNFNVIFICWHYFTIANRLEYIHFIGRRTFLKLLRLTEALLETQTGNLHALACKKGKA